MSEPTMREEWERYAKQWIVWARTPGHDSYKQFHRDQFVPLLPQPGRRTLDVGCGEGRLPRYLASIGHTVAGVDGSATMIAAARELAPAMELHVADAAALPFEDGAFDQVVSFMVLQDVDDLRGAVSEIGRVLEPGGVFTMAIVHPLNSAGRFQDDGRFVIAGSYLDAFRYSDPCERNGLAMTFVSEHRPLSAYFEALAAAGFVVETLREPVSPGKRWQRVPLFLHIRARKTSRAA